MIVGMMLLPSLRSWMNGSGPGRPRCRATRRRSLVAQEVLGPAAVGAPARPVDLDQVVHVPRLPARSGRSLVPSGRRALRPPVGRDLESPVARRPALAARRSLPDASRRCRPHRKWSHPETRSPPAVPRSRLDRSRRRSIAHARGGRVAATTRPHALSSITLHYAPRCSRVYTAIEAIPRGGPRPPRRPALLPVVGDEAIEVWAEGYRRREVDRVEKSQLAG